ncbi:hypothetical protein HanRHA438_Chr15g0711001 [Helianthus annuus]|uniref:Uncharacterized protein n=1 Tax=Helianthus annuus TaxID=4232 RepID=A0A9K3E2V6_HELAN|nr:hypothetical protein HanXRQr2_Chr15g0698801 [Helianthus annuus]KAJ0831734.1 hypothetical protein HanPSC8_Chr15g0670501 [Helianthus annuus]KAJ0845209.1 hypothetical protein HanRHA438_Chr15g0711001 [Helianthus annuus]
MTSTSRAAPCPLGHLPERIFMHTPLSPYAFTILLGTSPLRMDSVTLSLLSLSPPHRPH